MAFPLLETKRLKLIELTHQHVEPLYEILSLEEVTQFYGTNRFILPAEASRLIDMFHKNFLDKRGLRWGIKLKENQQIIGTVGLNALHLKNKRAEIGYELHPAFWKRGFASEAIKEVLRFSFNQLDLFRIGAVVYPENEASVNLLMKLGFSKEGILRGYIHQNEQFHDTYVLSLLQQEWKNSQE
ncbi:GNAT family N-acetyltransferase [Neobacillus sp. MM2021_6]|uniref:GNAT family N-acetyltransferase n=1 Tax=Bacillaceae TaxID=186817 RepID=UPI00140CDAB3|nr:MULTISPECIES: GNAT family N-acetyltransferase [Bacillaceae]MBO0962407.1 GNAT family N-acetyltransferase [Neobacillus sp. MM2021_6]NHC21024.1 GNAT family N-acetyltransferase [Bacillus sp. MM2020_4]WML39134.1 GNAT family N-acetyltransferase [Neobacillus sp. OS1-2]